MFLQDVHLHQLDMSKPRDIFKFARSFRESGKVLDVLVGLSLIMFKVHCTHILAYFQQDLICFSKFHLLKTD